MLKEYAIALDEKTVLVADVSITDESFDHGEGTETVTALNVTDLRIYTEINGAEYDVTSSLPAVEQASLLRVYEEEVFAQLAANGEV